MRNRKNRSGAGGQTHSANGQPGVQASGLPADSGVEAVHISDRSIEEAPVSASLTENLRRLQEDYFDSVADIQTRWVPAEGERGVNLAIVYLHTLVEMQTINRDILPVLIDASRQLPSDPDSSVRLLENQAVHISKVEQTDRMSEVVKSLLLGFAVVLVDGKPGAYMLLASKPQSRNIDEPDNESTVAGPKEGFVERLNMNMSLIRQRIQSPFLKSKELVLGSMTQTRVMVMYIEGVANPQIVAEVLKRLGRIKVDAVTSRQQLEEYIQDHPFSLFPLLGKSERSDKVAANLLEGRVAILVDGSPDIMFGPVYLYSLIQSPDDYYDTPYSATLLRVLRMVALFTSVLLPSIYIALTTFHQEMLPTRLAQGIAAGREVVPFPGLIEALLMEITFEFLREAGLRLPKPIGNAISIVGALVIGEAAVNAGLVSPFMVIVVAITAISSFIIPLYSLGVSFRILRFLFILFAGVLGFYGIVWITMVLYLHLASLRSLGVPYLAPYAPFTIKDMRDVMLRLPAWIQNHYPTFIVDEAGKDKFDADPRQLPGQEPNKRG